MKAQHSMRCNDYDRHGPHEWATWWCMGTDPEAAVAAANQRTSDGTPIVVGLKVLDYDRRETTVVGVQSLSHGTFWFKTANGGMFDGDRLQAIGAR